ncbi:YbfB/YjiJ family MFS transporter [Helicobacter sp. MIT 14-3879]|uniref:YbfB/YjiJ family MFS transporter n=1 Tax=Helicobacter sp. MIT 14-3879 TaxID=2040649 RepID=UPI000E1E76DB|nr:YbfB/YjiJ family MFS transporter [Helicobacter sp. MIT 14-3879]RDU61279.1 MFS transporter [Helicobacter sp. MIT 14-3879]
MAWRLFSCFLATFVSNGLARFGYVVLIPLLILSNKMSANQSVQLGIAILVGYIFGSAMLEALQKYLSLEAIAKLSFLIIALSFFACFFDSLPFVWAWVWRFFAGVASACLMVLAAPLCLAFVKEKHRSSTSGLIFSGIGLGAVFSGFVLPHFANFIDYVWFLLGGLSLVAFFISLFALKPLHPPKERAYEDSAFKPSYFLYLLIISYVLNAIGYLPHTLFWVDYLVRNLHLSSTIAGTSWAFFGVGSAIGALASGILAGKIGLKNAHILVLLAKASSCFIAAFFTEIELLNLSIFLMGFTTTGNVALTNALALHIVGKEHFAKASSLLTLSFGIFQAIFSFLFAYILGFMGYFWLFIFCGIALLGSLLVLLPIRDA